ncbi:MAG: xanthine dehydrogenase family protein subunit M [Desulfovermiculus sp.]|nr:xanthine dehydrogenase family protein subunit M [Desulfovermiculus sp.]
MQTFIGSRALPRLVYHRPKDISEALQVMGDKSPWTFMAGGTDFIPGLRKGVWSYPDGVHVVDVRHLSGLQEIALEQGIVRIGAAARLADIIRSPVIKEHAPMLAEAVQDMASLQVRNSATIGGNLCTASPAADTVPPLLVLEAEVEIVDRDGNVQSLPLTDFFQGPGQCVCRTGSSLLTSIRFPALRGNEHTYRHKMGLRRAFTISVISMAMKARMQNGICEDICLAFGAVAPTPIRARDTENLVRGRTMTPELIDQASAQASQEVSPISDVRASAEYRRDMAGVLTKRALHALLQL